MTAMKWGSSVWIRMGVAVVCFAGLAACTAEPVRETPAAVTPVEPAEEVVADDECAPADETAAEAAPEATAQAEPEPAAAAAEPEAASVPAAAEKTWSVGLESFTAEEKAKQAADKLTAKGYAAEIFLAEVKDKSWYRVAVGGFKTRADASAYRRTARGLGYKTAWLIPPE